MTVKHSSVSTSNTRSCNGSTTGSQPTRRGIYGNHRCRECLFLQQRQSHWMSVQIGYLPLNGHVSNICCSKQHNKRGFIRSCEHSKKVDSLTVRPATECSRVPAISISWTGLPSCSSVRTHAKLSRSHTCAAIVASAAHCCSVPSQDRHC